MNKDNKSNRIHGGHRQRMRAKLLAHGHEIFDAYELLEMLLYEAIPCIDTNPTAKRLLHKFGTLDALFCADAEEIVSVARVGKECAELILSVGEIYSLLGIDLGRRNKVPFTRYTLAGEFFTEYFSEKTDYGVAVMLLDNGMNLLDSYTVFDGLDYENGTIDIGVIVRGALDAKATAVITAHNHPNGPLFPTPGDRSTNGALTDALSALGVLHLEHFVVCGQRYIGIMSHLKERFAAAAEIYEFLETREQAIAEGLIESGAEEVTI